MRRLPGDNGWLLGTWLTAIVAMSLVACRWLPHIADRDAPVSSASASPAASPTALASGAPPVPRQPQEGYVEATVGGIASVDESNVVLLLVPEKHVAVPIFIGQSEAFSIQLRINERRFRRPLTHDLYDATLDRLGARVRHVRIDQIKSNTFHATLVLVRGTERHELDARSSDAIAIALGNGAPIYLSTTVVDKSGVDVSQIEGLAEGREPSLAEPSSEEEVPIKL